MTIGANSLIFEEVNKSNKKNVNEVISKERIRNLK